MYARAETVIVGSWQLCVLWEIDEALSIIFASRGMKKSVFMDSFSSEVGNRLLTPETKTNIRTLIIDGEWQQCIVDDKLYLRAADYDESLDERQVWDDISRKDTEEEYRKAFQTGSRALYFAQCADENEIWLPLLEKAFAKAHGDYSAIEGGFVG